MKRPCSERHQHGAFRGGEQYWVWRPDRPSVHFLHPPLKPMAIFSASSEEGLRSIFARMSGSHFKSTSPWEVGKALALCWTHARGTSDGPESRGIRINQPYRHALPIVNLTPGVSVPTAVMANSSPQTQSIIFAFYGNRAMWRGMMREACRVDCVLQKLEEIVDLLHFSCRVAQATPWHHLGIRPTGVLQLTVRVKLPLPPLRVSCL